MMERRLTYISKFHVKELFLHLHHISKLISACFENETWDNSPEKLIVNGFFSDCGNIFLDGTISRYITSDLWAKAKVTPQKLQMNYKWIQEVT